MSEGDITQAILDVRPGDNQAAEQLGNAYFQRLVNLARDRLGTTPRRVADEEDRAWVRWPGSLIRRSKGLRRTQESRRSVELLVTITVRKVSTQRRQQNAVRRGGGDVRGESVFQHNPPGLAAAPASEPRRRSLRKSGRPALGCSRNWRTSRFARLPGGEWPERRSMRSPRS